MFMLLNLSLTFLIFFIGCKPLNINNNYSSGNSNTPIVPPAGDEVKKGELLSTIVTKQLENADLDKFTSLTQEQLNEVLTKISAKDPAYKKDLMLKILAENKLNNFVKNNNLDDEFIKAMKTDDKDDYAFSNALLESALKDGNGIDKTVKKDIVKKVFAREEKDFISKQAKGPMVLNINNFKKSFDTKLGQYALKINNDDFTNDATKNKVADKLTKIFALGPDAIDDFYAYITPLEVNPSLDSKKINGVIAKNIISLIVEKKLLQKILTNNEQASALFNVVANIDGIAYDIFNQGAVLDENLAENIRTYIVKNQSDFDLEVAEKIIELFKGISKNQNNFTPINPKP